MLVYKQRYKPRTSRTYTKSDLTVYDSAGNTALNALAVYGKSEIINDVIVSAGDGGTITVTTSGENTSTTATFTTAMPLRSIPNGAEDVLTGDANSGEVVTRCSKVNLGTLTWLRSTTYNYPFFRADITDMAMGIVQILSEKYNVIRPSYISRFGEEAQNLDIAKRIATGGGSNEIMIRDDNYTSASEFKASLSNVNLIYELATPITTPLTQTEIDSIAGLRTFDPQTHIQNNAQTEMTVDYTLRVPTN